MDSNTLIPILAIFTLVTVFALGVWQFRRARSAEKHNEHSALSETRPELKADPHGRDPGKVRPMSKRVEAPARH